jgi:hypothetical protein
VFITSQATNDYLVASPPSAYADEYLADGHAHILWDAARDFKEPSILKPDLLGIGGDPEVGVA